MKRLYWIVGVGFVGLLIGARAGSAVFGLIYGLSVGLGFGTIFSEQRPTALLILYWALTLGIIGPLFGLVIEAAPRPNVSETQLFIAGGLGALVGVALGAMAGSIQWKLRIRRARYLGNTLSPR